MIKSFRFFVCFSFLINLVHSAANDTNNNSEKCYGILGCFGSSDFADLNGRPITFLPQSPDEINITFRLYTSENPYSSIDFKYNLEHFQLNNSPFNPQKKVKFIIHGFTGSFNEMDWMGGIKDLILEGQPNQYNVFGVDWSNGAKTINYFQAVANTRVVGAAMAHFIKKLNEYSGLKLSNVHLIGHSLGAHISGYTGERLKNPQIGRITGLDPAGPSFYKNLTTLRLDPTDAKYVDALHTDYGNAVVEGLGLEDPVGDIDFYPNGGYRQPACGKTKGLFNVLNQGLIKGITETVACNHNFAPRLMLVNPESLTENCQFVGYQCSNYDEFEKGRCTDCGQDGKKCAVLSIFGETDRGSGQAFKEQKQEQFRDSALKKYYYKTSDKLPYCLHHYGIEIHLANNSDSGTGSFTLDLEGSKRKADGIKVSETFSSFKPGETYTYLVTYEKSLGTLRRATMKWSFQGIDVLNPLKLISSPKMMIDRLTIKYLSNINPRIRQEESAVLCPEQSDTVSSGNQLPFVPCRGGQGNSNQGGVSRFNNGQGSGQNHQNQPHHQGSNHGQNSNQNRTQHGSNNGYSNHSSRPQGMNNGPSSSYANRPHNQQGNNYEGSYGNNRSQFTTSSYSNSRYSTTPSYSSTSRYRPTSTYYNTPRNNYDNNRTPSDYHTTPSYSSTSRYQSTTSSYSSNYYSTPGSPFSSNSSSSLYPSSSNRRPISTSFSLWNRRPALWSPDEPVRQYYRPLRVQSRPSFYSNIPQDSSDPRVKLHLGDNVGEIYRNLGERSFFTSALTKFLPVRVNQKFDEMFKPSTPSLLLSTDLRGEELSKPIVMASNSRSPLTWRNVPDRRFGESNPDNSRLMVKQRSQTNGKVMDFNEMSSSTNNEESRQNDKSLELFSEDASIETGLNDGYGMTRKTDKLLKMDDGIEKPRLNAKELSE